MPMVAKTVNPKLRRHRRLDASSPFPLRTAGLVTLVALVACLGQLTFPSTAEAATAYYLSPSGRDTASGTSPTSAWKTLTRASTHNYEPGDSVLLEGGATFSGELWFDPGEGGTASAPIGIGSYGGGRATINGGGGTAINIYDAGGFEISNLSLVGSGSGSSTGNGVQLFNDLAGNVKLDYIRIDDIEAAGFKNGVSIGGFNGSSGFTDVRVTDSSLHHNRDTGLITYGSLFTPAAPNYANSDVYVGRVSAFDNPGNPNNLSSSSGNGIVLGSVNGGTVERSIAYSNGRLCKAPSGPIGIWAYDSNRIVIQHNESYNNKTGGKNDGGGFDLDYNTSNSVLQYNYSHGNDGSGYLMHSGVKNKAFTGNTTRYNVSQNDGRKNTYGGLHLGGFVYNSSAYHNTIYVGGVDGGTPVGFRNSAVKGGGVTVRNNIFFLNASGRVLQGKGLPGKLNFQGNDYYAPKGLKILWGTTTYTSLSAWRNATGQEKLNGQPVGFEVNPLLNAPGAGPTFGDAGQIENLTAYRLQASSPMVDAGLDLSGLFGTQTGGRDFYGNPAPRGPAPDVGSHETQP